MAIRNKARREAIARHRLKMMIKETPPGRRRRLRSGLGKSLGFKGSAKNRADQVTNISRGRRARLTPLRMRRINEWYRRRALGQVPGVSVPDVNARDYFILNDNERIVLPTTWHKSQVTNDEFESDPNIWTIPAPVNIIINTVAHIRAFSFGVIDRGQDFFYGASFMVPWGDLLFKAVGDDIRDLFRRFNGVIYEAFMSPPPDQGYLIAALAFSDAGAFELREAYDVEIDGFSYGIFLESRRRPKGQVYKLKTVSM